jgi:hypothetical protein
MVQFTLQKKTMTSLAILEDRQAEVLSGGWEVKVGKRSKNSGNFNGNGNDFRNALIQIGNGNSVA